METRESRRKSWRSLKSSSLRAIDPLLTRFGALCLAALAIQQALVALSILALAKAAEYSVELSSPGAAELFVTWLVIHGALIILPYAPGVVSLWAADLWQAESYKRFHMISLKKLSVDPKSFPDRELEGRVSALFSSSYQPVLDETIKFTYLLAAAAFNSVFSVLVAAWILSVDLIYVYALSIFACAAYFAIFFRVATTRSVRREWARGRMISVSARMWPNVILGNVVTHNAWLGKLWRRHETYNSRVRSEAALKNTSNLALAIFSVGPVGFYIIWQTIRSMDNPYLLAATLVTLPRVFIVLNNLSNLVFLSFDAGRIIGKLRTLDVGLAAGVGRSAGRVSLSDLTITDRAGNIIEPAAALNDFAVFRPGVRYTIRGPNGAGKTTFLLLLKGILADSAAYLPADRSLDFRNVSSGGSTGQVRLSYIRAMLSDAKVKVLLLDEWDANLDLSTVAEIDAELNEMATKKSIVILDARHRLT